MTAAGLKITALPLLMPVRSQPVELGLARSENGQWQWRRTAFENHNFNAANRSVYESSGRISPTEFTGRFIDLFV